MEWYAVVLEKDKCKEKIVSLEISPYMLYHPHSIKAGKRNEMVVRLVSILFNDTLNPMLIKISLLLCRLKLNGMSSLQQY